MNSRMKGYLISVALSIFPFFTLQFRLTNDRNMLSFPMRILGTDNILAFVAAYPDSSSSLKSWKQTMQENNFKHFPNLKQSFGSADYVKPYTVFNIAGNKYRLISLIEYSISTVAVQKIMKHSEYDKSKWRR